MHARIFGEGVEEGFPRRGTTVQGIDVERKKDEERCRREDKDEEGKEE